MIYALDTNILSYFVQGDENVMAQLRKALTEGHSLMIPPVAYYEIRRGFKRNAAPRKERAFDTMCTLYPIGEMSIATWECAADIYANSLQIGRPMSDDDILIAAFCIVGGYTLVTNNTKDFAHVKGLQLVDWSQN